MKTTTRHALTALLIVSCSACTTTGSQQFEDAERGSEHRVRNTLMAVGAALIVGAILANRAQSNTRDAIDGAIQD